MTVPRRLVIPAALLLASAATPARCQTPIKASTPSPDLQLQMKTMQIGFEQLVLNQNYFEKAPYNREVLARLAMASRYMRPGDLAFLYGEVQRNQRIPVGMQGSATLAATRYVVTDSLDELISGFQRLFNARMSFDREACAELVAGAALANIEVKFVLKEFDDVQKRIVSPQAAAIIASTIFYSKKRRQAVMDLFDRFAQSLDHKDSKLAAMLASAAALSDKPAGEVLELYSSTKGKGASAIVSAVLVRGAAFNLAYNEKNPSDEEREERRQKDVARREEARKMEEYLRDAKNRVLNPVRAVEGGAQSAEQTFGLNWHGAF